MRKNIKTVPLNKSGKKRRSVGAGNTLKQIRRNAGSEKPRTVVADLTSQSISIQQQHKFGLKIITNGKKNQY